MAKRNRDATARSRIRAYLAQHGPVRDEHGGATTVLRDAIAYQGSPVAFIQLITAMDEAGEIIRDIRGKRTYGISAAEAPEGEAGVDVAAPTATGPGGLAIDYDELARALLRELGSALVATQYGSAAPSAASAAAAAELVAERDRLKAERDAYAARLESSRRQLNALAALYVGENEAVSAESGDAVRQVLSQLGGEFPAAERAS